VEYEFANVTCLTRTVQHNIKGIPKGLKQKRYVGQVKYPSAMRFLYLVIMIINPE
jgi:hypothetical protein